MSPHLQLLLLQIKTLPINKGSKEDKMVLVGKLDKTKLVSRVLLENQVPEKVHHRVTKLVVLVEIKQIARRVGNLITIINKNRMAIIKTNSKTSKGNLTSKTIKTILTKP